MKSKTIIYIIIFYFFANQANAYIDPGTGGILLQALLAAVAAVGAFLLFIGKSLKSLSIKFLRIKIKIEKFKF